MRVSLLSVASVFFVSASALAQTVVIREVDVIYGNQVIRGQHQIVLDSPREVDIIPAAKEKEFGLGPNVVITADDKHQSYLERSAIAEREQAIYSEVNQRTQDAPFTVLFTGKIPDAIQAKRLKMMPKVGIFGDQLDKLTNESGDIVQEIGFADDEAEGDGSAGDGYSAVNPGERVRGEVKAPESEPIGPMSDDSIGAPTPEEQEETANEALLEQLIGG